MAHIKKADPMDGGIPIQLGIIGGGPGSFIGKMHRLASRMDGRFQIVTGVVSSKAEKSLQAAETFGFAPDRRYSSVEEMFEKEAARPDGMEAVAIMTPNDSHHRYVMEALDKGFHVICDKPLTNTLEDAGEIVTKVKDTGLAFVLTHNYTGYPLVRQARAMVEAGELGTIRLVQVEYVQGGKAGEQDPRGADRPWRYNSELGGDSLVMGDIGTHAHNLLRYITGLEVEEISAEAGAVVPGREVHDYAGALMHLQGGARGMFWVTQTAAGVENGLKIRVSGTKGSLEWHQEIPQQLWFKPLGKPAELRTPNGPGTLPLSARVCRIVAGHPEGFPSGFANIYSDAAELINAKKENRKPDPLALTVPGALDGWMGIAFIDAVLESSEKKGAWVRCPVDFR